jgi:hypothetical protein
MNDIWNKAYEWEACEIAACMLEERGNLQTARLMRRGRRNGHPEVRAAMIGLMVARGEHEIERNDPYQRYLMLSLRRPRV